MCVGVVCVCVSAAIQCAGVVAALHPRTALLSPRPPQAAVRGAGMLVGVLQTLEEGPLPAEYVASLSQGLGLGAR